MAASELKPIGIIPSWIRQHAAPSREHCAPTPSPQERDRPTAGRQQRSPLHPSASSTPQSHSRKSPRHTNSRSLARTLAVPISKWDHKFESGSLQGRVCELSVPPETKDPCSELFAKSRAQNWAIWSSGALATLEDKARFAEPAP